MANSVLQIIGTLWLLVVTVRNSDYRAVKALAARTARIFNMAKRRMGCGRANGPRAFGDYKEETLAGVCQTAPLSCTRDMSMHGVCCPRGNLRHTAIAGGNTSCHALCAAEPTAKDLQAEPAEKLTVRVSMDQSALLIATSGGSSPTSGPSSQTREPVEKEAQPTPADSVQYAAAATDAGAVVDLVLEPEPFRTNGNVAAGKEACNLPLINLSGASEPCSAAEMTTPAPEPPAPAARPKPVLTRSTTTIRPVLRPTGMNDDELLRMLGEAFGQMMLQSDGSGAGRVMTDAEVEAWLQQLLQLYDSQQGSGTVSALHGSLKQKHSWLRLGDVYSALLYLKDRSAVRGSTQD